MTKITVVLFVLTASFGAFFAAVGQDLWKLARSPLEAAFSQAQGAEKSIVLASIVEPQSQSTPRAAGRSTKDALGERFADNASATRKAKKIDAQNNIKSGGNVNAVNNVSGQNINAINNVSASGSVTAVNNINAVGNANSVNNINAISNVNAFGSMSDAVDLADEDCEED